MLGAAACTGWAAYTFRVRAERFLFFALSDLRSWPHPLLCGACVRLSRRSEIAEPRKRYSENNLRIFWEKNRKDVPSSACYSVKTRIFFLCLCPFHLHHHQPPRSFTRQACMSRVRPPREVPGDGRNSGGLSGVGLSSASCGDVAAAAAAIGGPLVRRPSRLVWIWIWICICICICTVFQWPAWSGVAGGLGLEKLPGTKSYQWCQPRVNWSRLDLEPRTSERYACCLPLHRFRHVDVALVLRFKSLRASRGRSADTCSCLHLRNNPTWGSRFFRNPSINLLHLELAGVHSRDVPSIAEHERNGCRAGQGGLFLRFHAKFSNYHLVSSFCVS